MSTVGNGGLKDVQGKYNGLTVIEEHARAVHDGDAFSYDAEGSIPASGTHYFFGQTGARQGHFDFLGGAFEKGNVQITLYEAPTVTTPGTVVVGVNSNFSSIKAATLSLRTGGTYSPLGTKKAGIKLPLTGGGSNVSPASGSLAGGRVLKPNTAYLIVLENLDTNAAVAYGINFEWHESDIILS